MSDLKFSKSRFDLQNKCLGAYYYKYVEKLPVKSISWSSTIVGEAIHGYIEEFYKKVDAESYIYIKERIYNPSMTYKKFIEKLNLESFDSYYISYLEEIEKDKSREYKESKNWNQSEFIKDSNLWIWEILKFLIKIFDYSEFIPEKEFSFTINKMEITGIIDLIIKNGNDIYIIDFKTTKDSSKYYFIDWDKDPQSLAYYYALTKQKMNVKSFSYFCFNMEEKTIVVNSIRYNKDYSKNFKSILKEFKSNHEKSSDINFWKPSKDNCRWCDFKQNCKVSIK